MKRDESLHKLYDARIVRALEKLKITVDYKVYQKFQELLRVQKNAIPVLAHDAAFRGTIQWAAEKHFKTDTKCNSCKGECSVNLDYAMNLITDTIEEAIWWYPKGYQI